MTEYDFTKGAVRCNGKPCDPNDHFEAFDPARLTQDGYLIEARNVIFSAVEKPKEGQSHGD